MRRIVGTLGIIGGLLIGQVFAAIVVNAQPSGSSVTADEKSPSTQFEETQDVASWSTGFQIQNLGSATANVVITYYNQNGTVAGTESGITIPAGGSVTKLQNSSSLPSAFDGSAVISSDQPISTILNQITNTAAPFMSGSSVGFSAGATEVNLPLIMRGNGGWDTNFHVQNCDSADASVHFVFTPLVGSAYTFDDIIKPGSSKLYKQSTMTALGAKFIGSCKLTSAKSIAATVNETNGSQLLAYDGFLNGGSAVALPLIMKGNGNWFTGFQIQNTSASTATSGNIVYTAGPGSDAAKVGSTVTVPFSIAAGGSLTKIQLPGSGDDLPGFTKFIGSATVNVTGGAPAVMVVVNETNSVDQQGMSYSGFVVSSATGTISLPLLMKNNGGWFTGIQVQNVGSSSTTVTIVFTAGPGSDAAKVGTTVSTSFTLAPGASMTKIQTTSDLTSFTKFIGSATISSAQPVVAIVNELQAGSTGDVAMSYNGNNR